MSQLQLSLSLSLIDLQYATGYHILQVMLMDLVPDDKKRGLKTPVWDEYKTIVNGAEGKVVRISAFSTLHTNTPPDPDTGPSGID